MTDSHDSPTQPIPTAPLTPLTPNTAAATDTALPTPITTPEPGVAFHERVTPGRGHATATRVGVITGSALLVLVGVAAAMGASPAPNSTSAVGADPSAAASAPAPAASADPNTAPQNGTKPDHADRHGPGIGLRGGSPGGPGGFGVGFRDITIIAIDGSYLSLKTDDGWTRTITVTDSTTITKGGATIGLNDLAVGDQIRFAQDRAADGTYTVTAITVVLPTVVGEITKIEGNTITVTQPGGTTATIHVDSDTTYRLAGGSGGAGALSDLKVGQVILAEGTQRSDGSLDAASVRGGFVRGDFPPGGRKGLPDGLGPHLGAQPSPAPSSGAS
jgi:hypothetical protein